jgi:hypothetical protein
MMKLLVSITKVTFNIAVGVFVAVCWGLFSLMKASAVVSDFARAHPWHLRPEVLCPLGHTIPTNTEMSGAFYECQSCHWVAQGSYWGPCGNPECCSTAAFIGCPTCGLSVRNPYRWGH